MDKDLLLLMFCNVVNEVFGEDVKYVKNKTRYMKLFILTMDKLGEMLGYNEISIAYGWYKFGIFSFEAHDMFSRDIYYIDPIAPHLKIPQEFEDIQKTMKHIVKNLAGKFKMKWDDFDKFIHDELPDGEIKEFYRIVKKVNDAFDLLISDKITLSSIFNLGTSKVDALRKAIEHLENSIKFKYMAEDREEALYYYTDSLMLFLDNYNDNATCKEILKDMRKVFEDDILSIISPYPETLRGNEKKRKVELERCLEVINSKIEMLYNKIDSIENRHVEYFPTHDDLVDDIRKIEISEEVNSRILNILHK